MEVNNGCGEIVRGFIGYAAIFVVAVIIVVVLSAQLH